MRVVSVGDIHLNRHSVTLRLEILQDARLRKLHAELWTPDTDVRIFTEAKRCEGKNSRVLRQFWQSLGQG